MPINSRAILSPSLISMSHRRVLNPASIDPDQGSQILPITIDDSILGFEKCYVNIDVDIFTSSSYLQNIDATSTLPIKGSFQYFIYSGDFAGLWDIAYNATGFDQNVVVMPSNGSNSMSIRKVNLKGVAATRQGDGLVVADFSSLLLIPGFIKFGFFFDAADPDKVLGTGVTDAEVQSLKAVVNFMLVITPTYIT